MLVSPQVTFRNMDPSEAVEREVLAEAAKLEKYYDRISGCRVLVERPHRHQRAGSRVHVRIDLTVPGEELVISHEPASLHASLQDLDLPARRKSTDIDAVEQYAPVAVREAFDLARRRLQDFACRQRGDVKVHELPGHGRIVRRFDAEGYGFIEAADGHEVYFHQNSILNGAFDEAVVGAEVRFAEESAEKGPQASSVRLIGKHHVA